MKLESARALKQELKLETTAAAAAAADEAVTMRHAAAIPAVAIGIAPAERDNYRIAIRVREESARAVAAIERITAAARGEVDVRLTGPVMAMPAATASASRGIRIGMSVAHFQSTAGTLGCFAVGAGGNGFISNNHVIAFEDRGRAGDDVLQPGPLDAGVRPDDVVASLVAPYPLLAGGRKTFDCAFATLRGGVGFDPFDLGGGDRLVPRVAAADRRMDVEKIGRTTGRTGGVVSAFDIDDVVVDYPNAGFSVTFDDQIEIESIGGNFSEPGDSGSLVFDEFREAVGLLFATSLSRGLTYANPLQAVLDGLGVTLIR